MATWLVVGSFDKTVKIWDKTGTITTAKKTLTDATGGVQKLVAVPNGYFASGGDDGFVGIYSY